MDCQKIILNLLKDAYTMEEAIIELLDQHASNTDDLDLKHRLEEKTDSISDQSEKIKNRIEDLDDEVSTVRTGLAEIINSMRDFPVGFEKGRTIKDTLVEQGADCIEKSTFKAILVASRECKDEKTAGLCEELIGDERENAEVSDQILEGVVLDYINHEVVEFSEIDYTGEDEIL